jgi:DNA replication and repair protein RecF
MLKKIKLTNFRCFTESEFIFSPGINLVTGDNGSGKTSLLESVYFCARGRSFRSNYLSDLVHHNSKEAFVFSELQDKTSLTHKLGCHIFSSKLDMRFDGSPIRKRSELLDILPVQVLTPVSHMIIDSGPNYRRKFIDWGLFHVEHAYRKTWSEFNRVLKQRNQVLKDKSSQLKYWDEEFVLHSEKLSLFQKNYFIELEPLFVEVQQALLSEVLSTIEFKPGWAESSSLSEQLHKYHVKDSQYGFTHIGPHKADIRFIFTHSSRNTLSRGQQKMVVFALQISQCLHLARQISADPVLLIDDITSELDRHYLSSLHEYLTHLDFQVLISAIDKSVLDQRQVGNMFHVEHNRIK